MITPLSAFRSCLGITIPEKALAFFFDTLAVQLNAGRAIPDSLINSAGCSGDRELREIVSAAAPKLRNGASLTSSLRPFNHRFPEIVVCLLNVGEVAGGFGDSAQRLADMFKQRQGIEQDLKFNVYDPWFCLLAACLIDMIWLMMKGLEASQQDRPLWATAIYIAGQVAALALQLIGFYLVLRSVMRYLYRWESLRLVVDTLKLVLPRVGLVSRNLSAARWARSFAVLWGAGVNISTALDVSASSTLNAYFERELRAAAIQTRAGRSLSDALASTKMLPRYLLNIIRTSEATGRMDDNLIRISSEMERTAYQRAIMEMNRTVMILQLLAIMTAVIAILSQMSL